MAASLKFTQKVWQHFLQTKGTPSSLFPESHMFAESNAPIGEQDTMPTRSLG